jgi:tol-pal system protein YbgF
MSKTKCFLLLTIAVFILPSCVYDREMAYFNDEIVSLNRKVSALQEAGGGDLGKKLDTMQSTQARMRLELDQIKNELSTLSGRVDDNEHIVKRIVEEDLSEQDAMKAKIRELTERVETLDHMVRQQQKYLGLEPPAAPEEQAPVTPGPAPQAPGATPGPGPTKPEEAIPSGEVSMYDHALALYRQEKYAAAMAGFKSFLEQYPNSDRADNANFWIGESYMSLKKFEQAILAYQKVIKDFPTGNKVPNAMLRQAVAFLEIKDKTSARLLLKKIIEKYPGTNEAELAKKRLNSL